jgi:predicted nucleic acid-binding protein
MSEAGWVIDTDVVSESAKPRPDPAVMAWFAELTVLSMSSVTVYELARGVGRLARGRRRQFLEAWLAALLEGADILPFAREEALMGARIETEARRQGRSIDGHDLFILATARAGGRIVVTRNFQHFVDFGVAVYNPFTGERSA